MNRILFLVEDKQLAKSTLTGLDQSGYVVDWVKTEESALTALKLHNYGCLLIDLGLANLDSKVALRKFRQAGFAGALLILTTRDLISGRISGLESGSDDFILKPFSIDELSARIRSASRRTLSGADELLQVGDIQINVASRQVYHNDSRIILTTKEFGILFMLIENLGRVFTRMQLEESLYGWGEEIESNAIQVHIHHLRKKLGKHLIRTIHNVGYVIDKQVADS